MKNLSLLLFVCIGYQSYAMQAPLDVNKNIYFEQAYGWSSRQGPRPTMEDAHAALYPFGAKKEWGFYAIFDGHGGEETAEFAATHLPQYVLKALTSNPMVSRTFLLGGEFTRIDRALERENVDDGATALVALVENNLLRLAWAGDSRAIVIRGNAIVAQTKDHKPDDQKEKERIEKAGGAVFMGRVNGRLAVARALGDFDIKRQTPGGLISTPDFERVILENNDILVLACDGLWDVFSNEAVKNRLNELLAQNIESLRKQYPHEKPAGEIFAQEGANDEKMKLIARALRDDALQKGSRDNVSVMVVQFKKPSSAQLPLPPVPQRPQAPVPAPQPAPQPAAQPVVQPPVYQVPVLAPQPQQTVHEIAFTNVTGEAPLYVKVIGNNGALLMDQYIYPNQWTSRISIPSYGWPVTVSIRSGSGTLSFDTGLTSELLAQRLRESRIVIPADFRGNILTNIYLYRDTFKASAELRPY